MGIDANRVTDCVCWGGVVAFSALIVYGVMRMIMMPAILRPAEEFEIVRREKTVAENQRGIVRCEKMMPKTPYENVIAGDVWLKDFPMMDQELLPWCQIYTLARVFKYYGFDIDPQSIALELGVTTNCAPSVRKTQALLGQFCQEAGLRLKVAISSLGVSSKFVDDYNFIAGRLYKPQLYKPAIIKGGPLDCEQLAAQLDADVWATYLDELHPERFGQFWRSVVETIDAKSPLIWSVLLGFLKEECVEIRRGAGHMRVIVGYNPETEEILYSDSWGDRHKVKRMTVDDAYMITHSLWAVIKEL
jgi:hypothetical protein